MKRDKISIRNSDLKITGRFAYVRAQTYIQILYPHTKTNLVFKCIFAGKSIIVVFFIKVLFTRSHCRQTGNLLNEFFLGFYFRRVSIFAPIRQINFTFTISSENYNNIDVFLISILLLRIFTHSRRHLLKHSQQSQYHKPPF